MTRRIPLLLLLAIAAAELGLVAFAITPAVEPGYRAYYIERTSACLERPVAGDYQLGTTLSLLRGEDDIFDGLAVCGFEWARREGTWLRGDLGRIRIPVPADSGPLLYSFEAAPQIGPDRPLQRLTISANGEVISTLDLTDPESRAYAVRIPAEALAKSPGLLRLELTLAETRLDPAAPDYALRNSLLFRWMRLAPDPGVATAR